MRVTDKPATWCRRPRLRRQASSCPPRRPCAQSLTRSSAVLVSLRTGCAVPACLRCVPFGAPPAVPLPSILWPRLAPAPLTLSPYPQEETQAPFRKVRMFFYASFAAGASVGGLIAGTRILAALSGVSGAQPLAETVPNLVIDVVAVTAFALLLRRDAEAGRKRLARIAKTVDVGDLPVVRAGAGGGDKTVDLSTLRGRARPVIVSGRAKEVFAAVRGAEAAAADLSRVGVVVVPVVTGGGVGLAEPPHGDWLAMPAPADADVWAEWEDSARTGTRAKGGGRPPKRALMVLVVRKDGRIGARSFTDAVEWDKLVAEIDALPAKDQYGQPYIKS